jgi:hypothetical protein
MRSIPFGDVRGNFASCNLRGELGDLALIVGELELRGALERGRYTPTAAPAAASGASLRPFS